MRRNDLVEILCRLTSSCLDFETERSDVIFEFDDRLYEINFHRIEGKLIIFRVAFQEEVAQ